MSTLQISLAVLGIVFLGLVLVYNAWVYRRAAPRKAAPPPSGQHAVPRQEPDLGGVDITQATAPRVPPADLTVDAAPDAGDLLVDDPLLHVTPQADTTASSASSGASATAQADPMPAPVLPAAAADKRPALDSLLDAIALLPLESALSGETILQVQPTTRRAGSKPFQVEGRNAATGQWEAVRSGQRYSHLQAGVQLANRLGALNEIEFSEFVAKVQTFADTLGVAVELPDMLHEVARARDIDQFASQHDAQLSFMLRPARAAWSPGYIAQQAAALGFVPANMPGRMVLPAPEAGLPPLLTLAFDAQAAQAEDLDRTAVYDLLLSLDVPQVAQALAPFERLCQALQALGESMDGVLCDPDGNPLQADMLGQIGADLDGLYAALAAHALAAGSPLARRLFS
ncbi:cell division protein FtsZ [Comamonas nitrativorans]|uniref:Cell division protein FtsZ n=1 Tax=Comamonas nitrativorans TaxID=108437 RepID=A0ABV9GWG7_9BURK